MEGHGTVAAEDEAITIRQDEQALEDTPLLGRVPSQKKVRRSSSVVGDAQLGFHTIPADIPQAPEEPVDQALRTFREVFAILSVLLVGMFDMVIFPRYTQCRAHSNVQQESSSRKPTQH